MSLTREKIWKAADELTSEGAKTTVQAVRERVGYGSYEFITPVMAEWRARQAVHRAVATPMPDDLYERGNAHVKQLWTAAMAAADGSMQAEREALRVAQAELASEQQDLAKLIDVLTVQRDQAQEFIAALRSDKTTLEADLAGARTQAAASDARFEDAERLRSEERAERLQVQEKLDHLRQEVAVLRAGTQPQPSGPS